MCHVLCTKPTNRIPNQMIENKMASICPVFKWLGCLIFKWHLNTRPFSIQPLFDHLNTRLVRYSDPHCIVFLFFISTAILGCNWGSNFWMPFKFQSIQSDFLIVSLIMREFEFWIPKILSLVRCLNSGVRNSGDYCTYLASASSSSLKYSSSVRARLMLGTP